MSISSDYWHVLVCGQQKNILKWCRDENTLSLWHVSQKSLATVANNLANNFMKFKTLVVLSKLFQAECRKTYS